MTNSTPQNKRLTSADLVELTDILELIKVARKEEALPRLKRLAAGYPDNKQIRDLLLNLVSQTVTPSYKSGSQTGKA